MKNFKILTVIAVFLLLTSCGEKKANENKDINARPFWEYAHKPPMGWNSWDCYGPTVTESEVKANADYMAKYLKKFGWEYVVVDIRWYVENTKAQGYNITDPVYCIDQFGRFIPAANKFPSSAGGKGFKNLADYIHSLGLKFGIHVMRGIPVVAVEKNLPVKNTNVLASDIYSKELQCRWLPDMYTVDTSKTGAFEYYNSLFELYAQWEVDYVKIDDLSRPYHAGEIELIRKAIDECGRPMVLSLSPGATPLDMSEHAVNQANLWRISDDFWDHWNALKPQFERCANWAPYTGEGHWPDADMLPLGRISIRGERGADRMSGFTCIEQYTLMNLWAIFRSPLMFGGDLPSNDKFTLDLITNPDIIAVNQNSTGGREIKNDNGLIVWSANIPDSDDKYVAFFNITDQKAEKVSLRISDLGIKGRYSGENLWTGESVEVATPDFSVSLMPHGSSIYRLSKQ